MNKKYPPFPFLHLGLRALMIGWLVSRLGGSAHLAISYALIDCGTLLSLFIEEEMRDER